MCNSFGFFCCSSTDMLIASDVEKDPDVIPEDSSLLTLRYVLTVKYLDNGVG